MPGTTAVRVKFPLKYTLATPTVAATFTGKVMFEFASLTTLDQMNDGSYVDMLGRVVHVDPTQLGNSLPKKLLTITNGDYYENVELLGDHAAINVVENQVVALKGLTLNSWKGARTCSTALLTYVLLNPDAAIGKVAEASTPESPQTRQQFQESVRA